MTLASFKDRVCFAVLGQLALVGLMSISGTANGQESYAPKPHDALREPPQVPARKGRIDHQLNAVFGTLKIAMPRKSVEVSVRAY